MYQIYNYANEMRKSDEKYKFHYLKNYKIIYWGRCCFCLAIGAPRTQWNIVMYIEMRKMEAQFLQWSLKGNSGWAAAYLLYLRA